MSGPNPLPATAGPSGWVPHPDDAGLELQPGLPGKEVDRILRQEIRKEAETTVRLCFYFLEVRERDLYRELGYSTLTHYVEASLGVGERKAQGLLAFAQVIARYPKIRSAYCEGRACRTKIRELARVIRPETEDYWLEQMMELTSRELERLVYNTAPSSVPTHRMGGLVQDRDGLTRREVYFQVLPEEFQMMSDLSGIMSRDEGQRVAIPEMLIRLVQDGLAERRGGRKREGKGGVLPYLFVVYLCLRCRKASVFDEDGEVPVSNAFVALRASGAKVAVLEEVDPRAELPAEAAAGASGGSHVGTPGAVPAPRRIPAPLRYAIELRDRGRCIVPGCRNRIWKRPHHIRPWCEHREHRAALIGQVCDSCHAAIHDGRIVIAGDEEGAFHFTQADGTPLWTFGEMALRKGRKGRKLRFYRVPRLTVYRRTAPGRALECPGIRGCETGTTPRGASG